MISVPFVRLSLYFFFHLTIPIACSLKYSQIFFVQLLPLYTSCLFFILPNDCIVDIEKPDETFSSTFVVD